MKQLTSLFKYLSSESKLKIIIHLYMCSKAECDVQTLSDLFKIRQANLSKHLSTLRSANVIKTKTKGIYVYYYINKDFCNQHHELLDLIAKEPSFQKYACSCNDQLVHSH
ncbi:MULTISPECIES: helix-turn-helix transcriptional regulator [unclassified Mycoplasma]|uniref:ArsR/SmtB family transcription factor n=1 Tax=unclassified Mycoplasma TaxID=2683645 RepID=UPI00211CB38F|nr:MULTISPECIES: metalloregulator ArsR/SmtB family transcription factor [unclassified Mycoplasma]UUM19502.1 metalloregulator ArsR/SmtB family transcription factor [Mycoplasma sp. 1578d]UUM25125.1 metalloregulator ArsR/SmtB family transcription factor [Mycoplasma sp. 3686d]